MVSVSVCVCLCVHVSVYGWCAIYKLSIFGINVKWAKSAKCEFLKKIHTFKDIINRYIISSLWLAPVLMHNCAKLKARNLTMKTGEPHKEICSNDCH